LATTLFARLVLSDLFLHGIGGAKYDQVTDDIAQRFFGFSLPQFATASATLRLPIEHASWREGQLREIRQQHRELIYHPERFVQANGAPTAVANAIAQKRRWIAAAKTPQNAQTRHAAIVAANRALQPYLAPRRRELERERHDLERHLAVDAILNSREYSFCLFPRAHFERLLHV
jgi:hypothetical protein